MATALTGALDSCVTVCPSSSERYSPDGPPSQMRSGSVGSAAIAVTSIGRLFLRHVWPPSRLTSTPGLCPSLIVTYTRSPVASTWKPRELVRTPSTVVQEAPPSVERLMLVRENALATIEYTLPSGATASDTTRWPMADWSAVMPQSWFTVLSGSGAENVPNVVAASSDVPPPTTARACTSAADSPTRRYDAPPSAVRKSPVSSADTTRWPPRAATWKKSSSAGVGISTKPEPWSAQM